jgi:hypothetical protein
MSRETLLVTSFFNKNKKYINNFIKSINSQTDQNFDLLISTDSSSYKKYLLNIKLKKKIFLIKEKNKIFKTKILLIKTAKKLNYKFIVFADSDDVLSKNRIQDSTQLLKSNNVVINEIKLMMEKKTLFSRIFKNKSSIDYRKLILDGNIFGFGNTSINSEILKKINFNKLEKINKNIYACDWVFYGIIILNEKKIKFTNKSYTLYRLNYNQLSFSKKMNVKNYLQTLYYHIEVFNILKKYSFIYLNHYKLLLSKKIKIKNKFFLKKELDNTNVAINKENYVQKWHKIPLKFDNEICSIK